MTKENTTAKEVEFQDMDDLLGTKAATVIAPTEESKRSVLENNDVDSSFLDKMDDDTEDSEDSNPTPQSTSNVATPKTKDALSNILDQDINDEDEDDSQEDSSVNQRSANKVGRKPGLVEVIDKLSKKGLLDLFEDNQDISSYTLDDIEELIETNMIAKINEVAKQAPLEIFGKLDPKLQDFISYALNGGTDISNVLKNVARAQEITDLSLDNDDHQERIVREWLRQLGSYSDEEIEDEITSFIDRGDLAKKASQFKPKLDKKQAEIMEKQIVEQEQKRNDAELAKKSYAENIFNVLNKNDLNGLRLNNRIQTALYYGLTDTGHYQDREGNPTNELGFLLEKYQFGKEANPAVLLEALWLLKDPNGYRQSVLSVGQQQAAAKTYRSLKTAEGERMTSSSKQGEERNAPSRNTLQRNKNKNSRNIFSRD
jgi:hypothetical protein